MVVLVALESQILLTACDTWEVCHLQCHPREPGPSTEQEFLTRSNVNATERFKLGRLGFVRTVVLMLWEVIGN